jgi:hypothetical protein
MHLSRYLVAIAAAVAGGCITSPTGVGDDECIVIPGAGGVGCASVDGTVRDSSGRPMAAVNMYFGGSLTPGRVAFGYGENRRDNHITDEARHYHMQTNLLGAPRAVLPDTATVWILAARIDTLPSGVTIYGPRDSVAALLRFGPGGPTTPGTDVPTITLLRR